MMNLKNRLATLERTRLDNMPVEPALVVMYQDEPTPEQRAQIEQAEAIGQKVVIITVEDARKS